MKLLRQILFWYLFLSAAGRAEITPGDMTSWTNFSYVTCIAYGNTFAYFGTTSGILRSLMATPLLISEPPAASCAIIGWKEDGMSRSPSPMVLQDI
jgi:hypothetical protein